MDRKDFLKLMGFGVAASFIPPSAYPEAGDAPLVPPPVKPLLRTYSSMGSLNSRDHIIDIGFENAIKGYTLAYPTLATSIRNIAPAFSVKIEWLRADHRKGKNLGPVFFNYTQIVRTPFGLTGTELASLRYGYSAEEKLDRLRREALHRHLADVEKILTNGKRSYSKNGAYPLHCCGGIKEFPRGTPKLRVLRDLILLTNHQRMDVDMYQEEYLSEFSLQVN